MRKDYTKPEMSYWFQKIANLRLFRSFPDPYRENIFHLCMDVAWFGVLSGTTISFLTIYATRLGASGEQIGFINAGPALVNLILALPVGIWLRTWPIARAVSLSGLIQRFFYLAFAILPILLFPQGQIWAIILITFIMSVPGTGMAVGFNELFAESIPPEWRGQVLGVRNAILSIGTIISSLIAGQILTRIQFPINYQIVFAIGFLGAILSCVHVWFIRPNYDEGNLENLGEISAPIGSGIKNDPPKKRFLWFSSWSVGLPLAVLKKRYGIVILLLFFFHFSQFIAIPVFPIYTVNIIHLSDQVLSIGTSVFNLTVFLGSTQFVMLSKKFGNKMLMGVGVVLLSLYPGLIAISRGAEIYFLASFIGGFAWSLVGPALFNYLLENVPTIDRGASLSWYTLVFNAAVLLGSFVGPATLNWITPGSALAVFAVMRLLAGLAILRWG
jgi:MFS family permease